MKTFKLAEKPIAKKKKKKKTQADGDGDSDVDAQTHTHTYSQYKVTRESVKEQQCMEWEEREEERALWVVGSVWVFVFAHCFWLLLL